MKLNMTNNSISLFPFVVCLALYSKAKGQYLRLALPLHALFLQQPLPDNIPRVIPEKVQQAAINMAKLCIQHTALLAGCNVHTDQGIVEESMLTIDLEVTPPQTDDEKLQQQVIMFPGQVISGSKMTLLNKFRLGGGKTKVLMTFNTLKQKGLGSVTHGKNRVSIYLYQCLHFHNIRFRYPCPYCS